MSRFREAAMYPSAFAQDLIHDKATVVNDVTIFNWTGTNITSMTPTRVDTNTAGTPTGAVTFNATDTVAAAAMQVAIRALGGIYANATVVAGVTADNMVITVYGGYGITWAQAGGVGTFTESGAAGSDTAVPGSVSYIKQIPIGKFAAVKKVLVKGTAQEGTTTPGIDVTTVDADGKTVFSVTNIDTYNAGADIPYLRLLTADGVAGEDGAAAANTSGGLFRGPLTCTLKLTSPVAPLVGQNASNPNATVIDRPRVPRVTFTIERPEGITRVLSRTSGARTTLTGTIDLGAAIVNIKRIRLFASADTTVAPTLTDADGLVVYTKTSTDYTTAVLEQLSHDGVDQAGNAVADLLDVVAKSPLTLSGSGLGSGTFAVTATVEV